MSSEIEKVEGGLFADDRGFLRFVNNFDFSQVKRFYQVENHSAGFIRAWHGHKKEKKFIYSFHPQLFKRVMAMIIDLIGTSGIFGRKNTDESTTILSILPNITSK